MVNFGSDLQQIVVARNQVHPIAFRVNPQYDSSLVGLYG